MVTTLREVAKESYAEKRKKMRKNSESRKKKKKKSRRLLWNVVWVLKGAIHYSNSPSFKMYIKKWAQKQ